MVREGQFDGAEGLDAPLQRHHNRKILRWDSADETAAMLAGLSGDTTARSEAEKVTLEVTHVKT